MLMLERCSILLNRNDKMLLTVKHNGKKWEVDEFGHRVDGDVETDEDWYDYVRIKEGLPELTSAHRELLKYVQDYYRNNGIAPLPRRIFKEFGCCDIYKLFPTKNPIETIRIMAGAPVPIGIT